MFPLGPSPPSSSPTSMLRAMHRHRDSYPYPQSASATSRNQSTSSAFSASAHPHEDWTKITDLAVRRRIQNRIAQRNYRRKLKKRLEDLERRAASSASPELKPLQLPQLKSPRKKESRASKPPANPSTTIETSQTSQTSPAFAPIPIPEPPQIGFLSLPEDPIFYDQFPKSLSISPPPTFSYPTASMQPFSYPAYSSSLHASAITANGSSAPVYTYQQPFPSPFPSPVPNVEFPVKQELYAEVDMNSFNMSFAPIPNIEVTTDEFGDQMPRTPPLSECFESCCSSPESSMFAYTTVSTPSTPNHLL